jgi:hypothetical protein
MKLVYPVSEKKAEEIENELEIQKRKLAQSTHEFTQIMETNLSIKNWIREYPVQLAGLALLGGFVTAQRLLYKRKL